MSSRLRTLRHRRITLARLLAGVSLTLVVASCHNPPKWTQTSLVSAPGTVVDLHGNSGVSALPTQCQAGAQPFPPLPADWWQSITPSVRTTSAVTGYETWSSTLGAAQGCANSVRTDVYRAFFATNISSFAGKSGTINKATVRLVAFAVPGITPTTIAAVNAHSPNTDLCDAQAGSAFQLIRLAGAFPMPTGFNVNILSAIVPQAPPPIPNAYPTTGTVVLNLPGKQPLLAASLGHPAFEADVTQMLVSTLSQGGTVLNFMLTGTNEPPSLQDSPMVPQVECKALFQLFLDIQSA